MLSHSVSGEFQLTDPPPSDVFSEKQGGRSINLIFFLQGFWKAKIFSEPSARKFFKNKGGVS